MIPFFAALALARPLAPLRTSTVAAVRKARGPGWGVELDCGCVSPWPDRPEIRPGETLTHRCTA